MEVFKSMVGMVELTLTSADVVRAMKDINELGISVYNLQTTSDLSVSFRVLRRDYRRITQYAAKHGNRIDLKRREGEYWKIKLLLKRPILITGIILLLLMTIYIPGKVLFVEVEGNQIIPTRQILSAAEECGIRFGANRREVRSEQMKNALLSSIPELQWAGVNTKGCVAVITVKERSLSEAEEKPNGVSNIVARRDGVVLSCTVTQGTAVCSVGQAVQAGQILVSGYTDCGLLIKATRADGEILASTKRDLTVVTPLEHKIRKASQAKHTNYSLIVGKKEINFGKGSRIYDASCGKIYKEYYITLPGGYQLPLAVAKETILMSNTQSALTEENQTDGLIDFASSYLKSQMIAGVITDRVQNIESLDDVAILQGEYACTEQIGLEKAERNGE